METTASAVNGNRHIIMFRADKDPLTFKSNADFKRYLGEIGRQKAAVTKQYGPQTVAGQDTIHVPKSMYDSKELVDLNGKQRHNAMA